MGNIHVKLYEICTIGSERDVFYRHFLSKALVAPLFNGAKSFGNYCRRHHEEQFCEIILNLDQWFRKCC